MDFAICTKIFSEQQSYFPSQDYISCVGKCAWEGIQTAVTITQEKVSAFVTDPANASFLASGRQIAMIGLGVVGVCFVAKAGADIANAVVKSGAKAIVGVVLIAGCVYLITTS